MDETTKIKELKYLEDFEQESKKKTNPRATCLLSLLVVLFVICILMGGYIGFVLIRRDPAVATPALTQTALPPDDVFHLSLSSLSATIPADSSSILSFTINHVGGDVNSLCTGEFEIKNLSEVHKLHEEQYSVENDTALEGILLSLVAYDEKADHAIGEETPLFDGDKGQTNFHAGNDLDFLSASNRFTDGVSDWVVLDTTFLQKNRPQGGSSKGIPEPTYFQTETDLEGHSVDLIQRDIHKLVIQPNYYAFDVTWSFWEYTGPHPDTWVQMTPNSGVIVPSGTQEIQVSFNSANLSSGIYSTDLLVSFGGGCKNPISIPVTLTVELP